jgi:pantoate--beta-alanine ligase
VNPTQFGPQEDFSRYPRTLDSDLEVARNTGVSAVFVPTVEDVYPPGFSTFIEETEISKPLCGRFRPGHFRGVTTVVHRLFQLTRPDVALFGLKDLQQFLVLRRMVRDLGLPVQMAGIPTVREPDGLALSSRNRYLDPSLRERAPLLYRELRAAAEDLRTTRESIATLESAGFSVQYFERIELDGVRAIAAAAFLGTTRLIDNVVLGGL